MSRKGERGFTLLEALISIALATTVVYGIAAAVIASLHATNAALARQALADDALNVLSDLRTATAYDGSSLTSLIGRTTTTKIVRGSAALVVTLAVTRAKENAPIVAHVTITDPSGVSVNEQQQLYHEAPAPGSVVEQSSPLPASASDPHGGRYGP